MSLPVAEPLATLPEAVCAPVSTADELTRFFARGVPIAGADYQRAYPLPNGRVLWLFQDAFFRTPSGRLELVHNAGLVQSGGCFQALRGGSEETPEPYLFGDRTVPFHRWFWALGGGIGVDRRLHVFVAEMHEAGDHYLAHVQPVATWLVAIDIDTLQVVEQTPAPDASPRLYGWSVVSAGAYTYLYAHCYRQFGFSPLGFDPSCSADVTVARVGRGDFANAPEYWDGAGWSTESSMAVPVIPREGRNINPSQVAIIGGRFVAVTKVDDWWGSTVHLDVAPAAEGPWTTYSIVEVRLPAGCDSCVTYFASIVPYGMEGDTFVVALSSNTWGGQDVDAYRPTFFEVGTPPDG